MSFYRIGRRWTLDLHVGRRWLTIGRWPRLFVTYTVVGVGPRWHWGRQ